MSNYMSKGLDKKWPLIKRRLAKGMTAKAIIQELKLDCSTQAIYKMKKKEAKDA